MGKYLPSKVKGKKKLSTDAIHDLVESQLSTAKNITDACRSVSDETGYTLTQCRNAYYAERSRKERGPFHNHGRCLLNAEEEQLLVAFTYLRSIQCSGFTQTELCSYADKIFDKPPGTFKLNWARSFLRRHGDILQLSRSNKDTSRSRPTIVVAESTSHYAEHFALLLQTISEKQASM